MPRRKSLIANLFTWESKETRERRQQLFFARIYPFGKEQQELERRLIKELFPEDKYPEMLNFSLISLKEIYADSRLDQDDPDYVSLEDGIRDWRKLKTNRTYSEKTLRTIERLAELIDQAGSLEEMTKKEDIIAWNN